MILSYSNMYLNLTEGFTVVETQIVKTNKIKNNSLSVYRYSCDLFYTVSKKSEVTNEETPFTVKCQCDSFWRTDRNGPQFLRVSLYHQKCNLAEKGFKYKINSANSSH